MNKMSKKDKIILLFGFVIIVLSIIFVCDGIKLNQMQTELEVTKTELSNLTIDESIILPCPFCGSEDVTIMDVSGNGTRYCVQCNNCDALGPIYHSKNDFSDMSKQDAVTLWNKASKGE